MQNPQDIPQPLDPDYIREIAPSGGMISIKSEAPIMRTNHKLVRVLLFITAFWMTVICGMFSLLMLTMLNAPDGVRVRIFSPLPTNSVTPLFRASGTPTPAYIPTPTNTPTPTIAVNTAPLGTGLVGWFDDRSPYDFYFMTKCLLCTPDKWYAVCRTGMGLNGVSLTDKLTQYSGQLYCIRARYQMPDRNYKLFGFISGTLRHYLYGDNDQFPIIEVIIYDLDKGTLPYKLFDPAGGK